MPWRMIGILAATKKVVFVVRNADSEAVINVKKKR